MPVFTYYAADQKGFYYMIGFDLKGRRHLKPGDKVDKVYLTDFTSVDEAKLVWSQDGKGLE